MTMIRLTAADGHGLDAWRAEPAGAAKGAIVLAQEMYGLTGYLKDACALYASHGYLIVAPALYDRRERELVLDYTEADHDRAQNLYTNWDWDKALVDLDAAHTAVRAELPQAKVAILGYCWGGSLAWLAACRRDYAAAVSFYGSAIPDYADETPRCPVECHIGEEDKSLPLDRVRAFMASQPSVAVHLYPGAPHGFDNASRPARYHAASQKAARDKALAFLARHIR